MISLTTKIKSPLLDYFGGKWRLGKFLIEKFPDHRNFVDAFCGAGSILFKKPESYNEIINDIDNNVVNLMLVLRDEYAAFNHLVKYTPYSRYIYSLSKQYKPINGVLDEYAALQFLIRSAQGIGDSTHCLTGFKTSIKKGGPIIGLWRNIYQDLEKYHQRLRNCVIENLHFRDVLKKYDSEETFFFLDPPYLHETRSSGKYKHEMTADDHRELLSIITKLKGKVMLCGYANTLYNEALADWCVQVRATNSNGGGKRMEKIWMNYGKENSCPD